jgi:hypothetical protein
VARKKSKPIESGFALLDVLYEDGSRTSNRRGPRTILGGLDGDAPAKGAIEEQDNAIAQRAGRIPVPIKKIMRSSGSKTPRRGPAGCATRMGALGWAAGSRCGVVPALDKMS